MYPELGTTRRQFIVIKLAVSNPKPTVKLLRSLDSKKGSRQVEVEFLAKR